MYSSLGLFTNTEVIDKYKYLLKVGLKVNKTPYHDLPQLVAFGADVVHQHFVRCELVFNGQWVILTFLNLLQLNAIP